MGVKNLWRLLLPTAHRISIETLSHQTLAIDASIWMTQISKACRDPETGKLLPNKPHVRIFLLWLMRLLFHDIRPVVVFDGTYIICLCYVLCVDTLSVLQMCISHTHTYHTMCISHKNNRGNARSKTS